MEDYPEGFETDVKDKKQIVYDRSAADYSALEAENKDILFPYDKIRDSQLELLNDIKSAVQEGKNILAHAPTGLGKTIASMGPALAHCMQNKKTLFFLTSRQTQHIMAIKTLRDIKNKFGLSIEVLDLLGKKSMCLQDGIDMLNNSDFTEFCKNSRLKRTCEYYNNARKKEGQLKPAAQVTLADLKGSVMHTEEFMEFCGDERLCPYEIALAKAETAQVIIADYYFVFHPRIRERFFNKVGLELEDAVVIIDEAHNLPDRLKDLSSAALSNQMLERSLNEASKFQQDEAAAVIKNLTHIFEGLSEGTMEHIEGESSKLISKESLLLEIDDIDYVIETLENAAEIVREKQKRSSIAGISNFLIAWQGKDEGFARIFSKTDRGKKLLYECLDPSIVSKPVFDDVSSGIVISGTLQPTFMYKDLLGIEKCVEKEYDNPFPKENALSLIVPVTTTKYSRRSDEEFENIAKECANVINEVSGNIAIFFPSYFIRDRIYRYLPELCEKDFVLEQPSLNKFERAAIIKDFTKSSLTGRCLLAASSGSFGEGIDLPGHFLSAVIVVGLPLKKPTLEVKQLISYYNDKFGKGWDYGYFYPSFNKTFQNVGRCIRSETDKGIMIYLDERFAESRYLRFFGDRNYKISFDYLDEIKEFQSSTFSSSSKPSSSDVSGSMSSL